MFEIKLPFVTVKCDGTVVIHKEGGDKEAAKAFYDSLQIEGVTLHQKIEQLQRELAAADAELDRAGVARR